jgi:hypothetical protein
MRTAPLIGASALAILASCVIPAPLEEAAEEENLPPFAEPGTIQPESDRVVAFEAEAPDDVLEFRVGSVGDANLEDALYYRWFVNPRVRPFIVRQGQAEPTDTLRRDFTNLRYEAVPCEDFRGFQSTLHTVQLIVADRPFLDEGEPRNRALPEDAGSDTVTWFVEFDPLSQCPQ